MIERFLHSVVLSHGELSFDLLNAFDNHANDDENAGTADSQEWHIASKETDEHW
jgi:hypothetical protein